MECSCAVDVYAGDCEPVSLLNVKIRKAVKDHICQECKRDIPKGEEYEYVSYLFEGKFWRDKTCKDCLTARKQFYPRGGHCPGGLWFDIKEEINDSGGEIPEACISRLTPIARGRLCDMLNDFYQQEV